MDFDKEVQEYRTHFFNRYQEWHQTTKYSKSDIIKYHFEIYLNGLQEDYKEEENIFNKELQHKMICGLHLAIEDMYADFQPVQTAMIL